MHVGHRTSSPQAPLPRLLLAQAKTVDATNTNSLWLKQERRGLDQPPLFCFSRNLIDSADSNSPPLWIW